MSNFVSTRLEFMNKFKNTPDYSVGSTAKIVGSSEYVVSPTGYYFFLSYFTANFHKIKNFKTFVMTHNFGRKIGYSEKAL